MFQKILIPYSLLLYHASKITVNITLPNTSFYGKISNGIHTNWWVRKEELERWV